MSVGVGMFKYYSLVGIFPLTPPPHDANISPIKITSSFTSVSLRPFDPWVVPFIEYVESYEASMPLTLVYISYQEVQSTSTDYVLDSNHDVESE
jgi:hypothetical protein